MLSIISAVGMSVFGKPSNGNPLYTGLQEFEKSNPQGIERILQGKDFPGKNLYEQTLAVLRSASDTPALRKLSAELNAIEGIHATHKNATNNKYCFLASDTAGGALAARVLADFCNERYGAFESKAVKIDRLQVKDPDDFRATALPYLIQVVYEQIDKAKADDDTVIINPTGGFKATIPYLTLIGMLQKVEVSYIYEFSEALITLAGLPVTLDFKRIATIAEALEKCKAVQNDGVALSVLSEYLGLERGEPITNHPLWSLFEPFGDDAYILSGLGEIALTELRSRAKRQKVWLSKQATEAYDRLRPGSVAWANYTEILNRISDPAKRVPPYRHAYRGTDFPAFKYKGNERLFYYEHPEGYVLILALTKHRSDSDYGYEIVPTSLDGYTPYREWEQA